MKVGLITNGGVCNGCGNKDDEPVARATVDWVNEHQNGIAGHPIDLVVCVDANDPGKTADCANQMISDDVAAVIIGTSGVIETTWKILHDAKIPMINVSTTNTAMLADTQSTYILNDPGANTIAFPIGVAKQVGAKKLSVIVIDVPAATDIYKTGKGEFTDAGLDAKIIPVALGTADMTPQAQQIFSDNPDGLVMIVGHDQFCIPAIQGLQAVGFHGTIATISQCVTDAMRKALPSSAVKGIQLSSLAPIGVDSDPLMRQYNAGARHVREGQGHRPREHRGYRDVPERRGARGRDEGSHRRGHARVGECGLALDEGPNAPRRRACTSDATARRCRRRRESVRPACWRRRSTPRGTRRNTWWSTTIRLGIERPGTVTS